MERNANRQGYKLVFCRFITKKGRRIYPKTARFFRFWAKGKK
jgi:hypothetical protein